MGLPPRFWDKVKIGPGCWEWQAGKVTGGYGSFKFKGQTRKAHRLVMGDPLGICVLHHCDSPGCVRPSHLFLGTQTENIVDRDAKGRQAHGEKQAGAKLSFGKPVAIRVLYKGGVTQDFLAAKYGVSQVTISRVVRGKTWV